ncbi:glycoside hydrolase family 18 protein [Stachybotrys elegans]|uniref:chitinase n=1 Tax=Stachybotrys elegans TaxID=80388 RepID=A0A8K0SYN6_9HYPO|nr:glycoside hydrolase family 18 protein [Stachybotrys elegans]
MYLTGQHPVVPSRDLASSITHVILAFMQSHIFDVEEIPSEFPLFTTVAEVRKQFEPGTKVMVAIGGWGDRGFESAARNETSRRRWARTVKAMVDATGADGVDLDWEYPGGNRDDYKLIPNSERVWEIEAFVDLVRQVRSAIGSHKLLSMAVPGLERDMMAFTNSTVPRLVAEVDFINIMTYDLMNRRDRVVKHHSGVADSVVSMKNYMARGAPRQILNLGLGYYVKWFYTEECDPDNLLSCPTVLLEDPDTGADTGNTGGFSWHDETPADVVESFARARRDGQYFADGSYGYWDAEPRRWWSFDTERSIRTKMEVMKPLGLGGVFAWGLGEDAPEFSHLKATIEGLEELKRSHKEEL